VFVHVSTLPTRFQFVHFVVLRLVVRWENSPICDTCTHKTFFFKSHTKIHKAGIHRPANQAKNKLVNKNNAKNKHLLSSQRKWARLLKPSRVTRSLKRVHTRASFKIASSPSWRTRSIKMSSRTDAGNCEQMYKKEKQKKR